MTFSTFWSSSSAPPKSANASASGALDGDTAEKQLLAQLRAKIGAEYLDEYVPKLSPNDPVLSVLKRRDSDDSSHAEDFDGLLLRFLRYNSRDINKASDQFRKFLHWRAEKHVYNYTDDDLRGKSAGLPIHIHDVTGTVSGDTCGLIFTSAKHYVKKEVDSDTHERGVIRVFEKLFFDLKASSAITIVDFSGVTISQCDIQRMKIDIIIFLNYYPETFRKFLFINYPKFIYGFWKIIKPILDERTSERVEWCETHDALPKTLEKYFAKEQIPAWLGGSNTESKLEILCGIKNPDEFQQELCDKFAKISP